MFAQSLQCCLAWPMPEEAGIGQSEACDEQQKLEMSNKSFDKYFIKSLNPTVPLIPNSV
jgi:hypothetical protein